MRTIIVTGSSGLVVSETVRRFAVEGARVIGIDNDVRAEFFRRRSIGGSRQSNCSMLEAIEMCEEISGKKLNWTYEKGHSIGDHIWWISDAKVTITLSKLDISPRNAPHSSGDPPRHSK